MVFDSVAFKAVISNGLVLDKFGQKMSKRLGNAIDPFECIEKYGSDPVRWYMITNSSPWDNLKFDEEGVKEVSRSFFAKLFQSYAFFAMYANVDNFNATAPLVPINERPEIDRWILSELQTLINNVQTAYEEYEPTRAGRMIESFVADNLSNWYVRLNRKRFWAGEMDADKLSAYQTLFECLLTTSKLMAPIAPYYADRLYRDLTEGLAEKHESVHLAKFPQANEAIICKSLEEQMGLAQKITSMVLSLRKKERIIVRQPLQRISIPMNEAKLKANIEAVKQLILDEVNVKELVFVEGDMLEKKVKCNFRVMGKKYGKLMKAVATACETLSKEQIATLEQGELHINVEGQDVCIERTDVEIISEDMPGWTVINEGTLTVALDLTITEELKQEGLAREIVKRVQNLRKESGFEITDRISIVISPNQELETAVNNYEKYICTQVLADEIKFAPNNGVNFDFEEYQVNVEINKQ
jgi:isoleucyl-tRNA synthetase